MVETPKHRQAANTVDEAVDADETPFALRVKWGNAIDAGFTAVPNVLLEYYASLDITPTEYLVLLQLAMHWKDVERLPYPRVTTLAKRLNVKPRTVQRALNRLRAKGLLTWERVQFRNGRIIESAKAGDGIRRRRYDLGPLVGTARKLAEYHDRHRIKPAAAA